MPVDRSFDAVNRAGVPLHVGVNRRFDPCHRAVRDAVAPTVRYDGHGAHRPPLVRFDLGAAGRHQPGG